jgi:ribosomal protein S18 acetylase RimI-like enzyme
VSAHDVELEAATAYRALADAWRSLYAEVDGARLERRTGLLVAICPGIPVPPFNGPWILDDSPAAAESLPAALADVEAAGEEPFVLGRARHGRVADAARALGLTDAERLPVLVARPDELLEVECTLDVSPIERGEIDATLDVLTDAFGEGREIFARIGVAVLAASGARWYVGRVDGAVVCTAVGVTAGDAVGIFNVATAATHRRRGHGSALTAHAARDGFADGAGLAYLQASPAGHSSYRRIGFRDVDEYVALHRPRRAR